jgi:hypothetical protein
LARFFRAIANPYVLGIVAIAAVVLLVLEIRQPGTICEFLAVYLGRGREGCWLPNNMACNLNDLKDKRYRWDIKGVQPIQPAFEDKGFVTLNVTEDKVDFLYNNGGFSHKFSGKCLDYNIANNLNSSKIIVGTFKRTEDNKPSNDMTALAVLVARTQGEFVFFYCPAPFHVEAAADEIEKGHCASGTLTPD